MTDQMQELLTLVSVDRVSMTRDRSSLRVYIVSSRLIDKRNIWSLEKGIREQLFPGKQIQIRIFEKYTLSEQYTPEKLLTAYRDSLQAELKEYSIVEYAIFRKGQCTFPRPDLLHMTVEDTMVNRDKAGELKRVLEKVFHERCGLPVEVEYEYVAPVRAKASIQRELQARQEAERMTARAVAGMQKSEGGRDPGAVPSGSAGKTDPGAAGKAAAKNTAGNPEGKTAGNATGGTAPAGRSGGKKEFKKNDWSSGGYRRKSDNPDVLFGRDFEDDFITIEKIEGEIGEVTVRGKILDKDSRELRSGKTIIIFHITDFTDTITVKVFANEDTLEDLNAAIKPGTFIRLCGMTTIDRFDGELTIGSVRGIKKAEDFTSKRMDHSPVKRVELHCHTKMSDMDGVSDVASIIKKAKEWGMEALAVTDHGCVQAFTEASHALDKNDPFKMLYGVEGYLVDDMKDLVENPKGQTFADSFVVFDIETTGFSPEKNRIIEIGAVKVEKGVITDKFSTFVNPDVPIPFEIEQLTGINDNMVLPAPKIDVILPQFLAFCEGCSLVAHNASFDVSFISQNAALLGLPFDPTVLDTVALARHLLPNLNRFKLDTVAKALNISLENHHRAVDDAGCTAEIFVKFIEMLKDRGVEDLEQLNRMSTLSEDMIKKLPTNHIIIIAKNEVGRINLYRLVSWSHINYFAKRPRIPKSVLSKFREGLLIGSACEAGELYQALLRGLPEADIIKIANFYDFLEIQPLGNNAFMLRDEKSPVKTEEDLKDLNRRIVKLGETLEKPVCGTCDVHFLNPEDEVYRRILMAGQGFSDADQQAPLYLRTTEEMLKEFDYLGPDKAEEVVITNTRMIADMCEKISPVRPDKCPPVIENSDETLRKICYDQAHEMYGEDLPEIVSARLEKELNSIISNGFAVMYIIAQKLVWKSNEDGYLVGSRGSVGSSFVANMAGITEVNSLSPHYLCPKCHYSDFDSEDVKKFSGMAGCDMPDLRCPKCGAMMSKQGFDIPFETFLGFKGDKEPDIDLNFSGEYQSKAHDYTEVIFGKGQTFRAGTIGTLADNPHFHHTVVNALDRKGLPSWPQNYTLREIAEMRGIMGERRFQREYMNNPVNAGTVFEEKHIRFGKMLRMREYRAIVCYTDPSFKASATADFKATMLVGITPQGKYHVLKAYADQTKVSTMVEWHYDAHDYVGDNPVRYEMEAGFMQDLLLDEFRKYGEKVGYQIPIVGDTRKKPDKFARIEALQPLFERGDIIFNELERDSQGMRVLIEQLLCFEKGSKIHDDAPDALEGAIWKLSNSVRKTNNRYAVGHRASRRW